MRKEKKRKNLILRLFLLAFVIYAVVMLMDMQMTVGVRRQELAEVEAKVEAQRIANKELKRQLQQSVDEEYIERIARENGYVYPDERVYFDISGS